LPTSADNYRGKRRFDDDEPRFGRTRPPEYRLPAIDPAEIADQLAGGLPPGQRWSTWDQSTPTERGPRPHHDWLVTDLAATDVELGIIKTGKEADVCLLRRGVPGTGRSCLLAVKRYRSSEHRMFHRDDAYREGRRVRNNRETRAMAKKTAAGRDFISREWANAEFTALCQFYLAGVAVPYPVQIIGTEVLLEFIGDPDGTAAPRLAETGLRGSDLAGLWEQLVESMLTMARLGVAHGDLSAYNLLVHEGRLVVIDIPQAVDVIANPQGAGFLDRDAANVGKWFSLHGLTRPTGSVPSPAELADALRAEARISAGA
jgi:RIO kinase 1